MVRLTVVPNAGEAEVGGKPFGGWRDVLVDSDDVTRARELLPANL
jgi:hypothetical protein